MSTQPDTPSNRTPRASALGVAFLLAASLGACISAQHHMDGLFADQHPSHLRLLKVQAASPFAAVLSMSPHVELTLCHAEKAIAMIDTGSERGLWTFRPNRPVSCSHALPANQERTLYVVDHVKLGRHVWRNVRVSDSSGMPSNMQQADFAIGMEILREFQAVAFDWMNNRFFLGTISDELQGASVDVLAMQRWRDDSPIVGVSLGIAEQRFQAAIDTGFTMDLAIGTTLFRSARLEEHVVNMRSVDMPTTRGMQAAQFGSLRIPCVLGTRSHADVTLLVLPDDGLQDFEQYPLIIGAGLLRRYDSLTLDFANQRVLLTPSTP